MSDEKTALVVSAHSADFVWRAGGAIALHQEKGFKVLGIDIDKSKVEKINNAKRASNVVKEVIIVLLRVSLIDLFKTSNNSIDWYFFKFSLILSKTITVSFNE